MKKKYQFEFKDQIFCDRCYGLGYTDVPSAGSYLENLEFICHKFISNHSLNILEWGSGITSLMFSDFLAERGHGGLLTIDHNIQYQEAVCEAIQHQQNITALTIDCVGPRESQSDPELNYSSLPLHFVNQFDLIFVDGRRRVECAYNAALIAHADTLVVIHDYRRYRYQSTLILFDVIEDGPHFRVMRVKPGIKAEINKALPGLINCVSDNPKIKLSSRSGRSWIHEVKASKYFNILG